MNKYKEKTEKEIILNSTFGDVSCFAFIDTIDNKGKIIKQEFNYSLSLPVLLTSFRPNEVLTF